MPDKMAFIHSMTSKTNTHGPACVFMNTGFILEGFPSATARVSYALGSANDNLPTYVAILDIRGSRPPARRTGARVSCPPSTRAIVFNAQNPIRNLKRPASISDAQEEATRDFLGLPNRRHADEHSGDSSCVRASPPTSLPRACSSPRRRFPTFERDQGHARPLWR
ncbi:MAG: DUF1501 domain-containing protein [Bryobacterales bacterium]